MAGERGGTVKPNLVDRLRRHATAQPDAKALRFLDGDVLAADLTYRDLDARIRAVAAHLQQCAPAGERAVLLFPSGVDYVVAFNACLYAGLIAVPAYPPERGRVQHAERLRGILEDAEPRLILTTGALSASVAAELPDGAAARIVETDAIRPAAASDWREFSPPPDSLAFLQYTSGSTSSPKGVRVSHANLEANELAFTTGFGMTRDDVFVSWLPLFHDMGLIGGLLQPLHLGIPAVLMSPKSFVERPRRWLDAIARFGGTVAGAPDFAYALCADRISEATVATLDLRGWRLAFSGAEFVRATTLARFTRHFALAGFSPRAFFPAYGLAEATLFVSAGVRGEGAHVRGFEPAALAAGRVVEAPGGTRHVALGHTPTDHALRIMREDGAGPAEPDTIGEIWFAGPSIADGYWRNADATSAAFVSDQTGRWLRTGDLGFERDGRLYVTGRIKDMLIVRGENLFPQDIEQAVEADVEAVRRGRVAAFPVEVEGREGIGIAAEFSRGVTKLVPAEALRDAIGQAVARQCGEAPAVVVILNPRGMPLTTSGKLQRSACAASWARENGLDSVAVFVGGRRRNSGTPADEAPSALSDTEEAVAQAWRAVLGVAHVGRDDDFFLLGGNSIAAAQVADALRERCRVEVELSAVFVHPTPSAFAAHLESLPRASIVPPIVPVPRARLALSHAQERLWFLWQMDPTSTAYSVAVSIRLAGALDADALLGALDRVVARHEALRTTFEVGDDGAVQIVHPEPTCAVHRRDLRHIAEADRVSAMKELTTQVLAIPFDLTTGPLLRATLARLDDDSHELLLSAHHIVIDGVSLGVLLDELAAFYRQATRGDGVPLPGLDIHYADYAAWQRDWLAAGESERQLAYWRARLGAEQPVLDLPLDRPRPAAQSHRGDSIALAIDAPLAQRLGDLARAQHASVFMVLLAAYALLLHRYTGQDDIRIGAPTANRRSSQLDELIGFFVNTLVMRVEIDATESFVALLARIRATVFEALAHQDVPFERLVEHLQPERSLSRNPLFQAKLNYMAEPRGFESVPGIDASIRIVDLAGSHFDLALDVLDGPQGMTATFNFATDLFDRETIERLAAQFGDFLAQAAQTPERSLHAFDLCESSRQTIATETEDFTAGTFLDLFQVSVSRTPDALALADAETRLTYAELDALSTGVARALLARDIQSETPVGLVVERSSLFVVGVLGAMKAGAVPVLLDPEWPDDRLRAIVEDAGIDLLLSAGAALPTTRRIGRDILDLGQIHVGTSPTPLPVLDPRATAYIVTTSGSTGRPKSVAVPHSGLTNYMQAVLRRLAPQAGWSMAMVSTVAADLGHTVLFGALGSGAALHLMPRPDAFDAERFAAWMGTHAIDVLKIVPSHLRGLLRAGAGANALPRRVLVLGGEALDAALVGEIRRLRSDLRIVNHYGPTETTVGVLSQEVGEDEGDVPIGLPLANVGVHVLDGTLGTVPSGVTGELYVGGAGLARGYRGMAAQTAERFVPDPFGLPGSRLYRTGDRVRCDARGRVHFLGRGDDQIKLRGHRIEPGEIARVLAAQEGVAEAFVMAQPVPSDATRRHLVAYAVPVAGAEVRAGELKARLAARLPDPMLPAHIVLLDKLPLGANGKVDRAALPRPEMIEQPTPRDAPEGEVESAIAEVWAQVLRLETVGATDNFFELGGDSILSLQVIARLRKRGIKLTAKQVFDRQTIRGLAAVAGTTVPKPTVPSARPAASAETVRLLPIQDRFFAQVAEERHHWNQSLLFAPRERLDPTILARALAAVVAHHDALHLRFAEGSSGWSAGPGPISDGADLLRSANSIGAEAATALFAEAQASLDLAAGRLVQALLLDRPDGSQRLLLAIHHLVVDGVSWRILLEDIATAYAQAKAGESVALGPKTEATAAWAERLHALVAGGTLSEELPFWLDQGAGAEAANTLPSDVSPTTPECFADAETVVTSFDADLTERLLSHAPAAYRTRVNDLLLAALARCVGRWSGHESVLIELEGHGREDLGAELDVSRTVGWLTTTFPLRLDGAGAETGDLVKRVKERLRALPSHGLGYGLLARFGTTAQRAALAALPEPQITFNYLGQFDASFGAEALLHRVDEDAGPSRSPKAPLTRPLTIDGEVRDGCLRLSWRYGRRRHARTTILRLAADYERALREIVAHCTSGAAGLTPSDVPLSGLDQPGLDALLVSVGLAPRDVENIYPLAPTQQGILFHALQDDAGSRAYVNQIAITVADVEPERVRAAWQAATRRHAVLRTSIHWRGIEGVALQVVHRDPPLRFSIEAQRGADIIEIERSERAAGFTLDEAPLQRVRLVRLDGTGDGPARHRLIWTSHHLIVDGWSSARLMAEVLGGVRVASGAGLYRDYIAYLQARDPGLADSFWREQLASLDEPTYLAETLMSEGRPAVGRGTTRTTVGGTAFAELQAFARRERITLNTLIQGALALMLRRLTGHAAIVFGVTMAGRPADLPGADEILGLFINTLPMVDRTAPDVTVGTWLRALQDRNLAMREHEHTPLSAIQRFAVRAGQPLFDTILVFENYPVDAALEGPAFTELRHASITNYPLTISAFAHADSIELRLDHDLARFSDVQADLLSGVLAGLLEALASDADRRLGAIPMPCGSHASRTGTTAILDDTPVHVAFASQARLRPEAEALVCGDESLTYADLAARADRLARALACRGIGPGAIVGIALPRTPALVVALVATLQTGAAYLPLDPAYPAERLANMVEDARPRLVLVQDDQGSGETPEDEALAPETRAALDVADLLALDAGGAPVATEVGSAANVRLVTEADPAGQSAEDLAYVIYTSGSTGTPKGVMVPHRALSNVLASMAAEPGLAAADTVLALTSLSFDIAVLELLLPLGVGARIVLAPRATARDPQALTALARRHRVSVIQATPSTWRLLVANDGLAGLPTTCRRWSGGEALPADLARRLAGDADPEARAETRAWTLYGPTETTIWSACAALAPANERRDADAPPPEPTLGDPVAATSLHVLDADLHPAPAGLRGELFIGGAGLARGYLGRPALTAERFVPDPFGPPGARLYRTGDLAVRQADGALLYRGRGDDQVKIRGHRIEPGEIEARFLDCPGVAQAAVVARPGPAGLRLIGYVVAEAGTALASAQDGSGLRTELARCLPDYMVPSEVIVLERLPLTPNGKIDRRALPEAAATSATSRAHIPPATPTETALVEIWKHVLALQVVGTSDDFFDLGGDSVQAIRVVSRIRERFDRPLTPRDVFAAPTIAALARAVDAHAGSSQDTASRLDAILSTLEDA